MEISTAPRTEELDTEKSAHKQSVRTRVPLISLTHVSNPEWSMDHLYAFSGRLFSREVSDACDDK